MEYLNRIQPMPTASANIYPPAVAHAYPANTNMHPHPTASANLEDKFNGESALCKLIHNNVILINISSTSCGFTKHGIS
jgi:hypothetical protein